MASEPNANGAPTWQDDLHEQSYGPPAEPEADSKDKDKDKDKDQS